MKQKQIFVVHRTKRPRHKSGGGDERDVRRRQRQRQRDGEAEAVLVSRLRQAVFTARKSHHSSEVSHRGETLPVHDLQQTLREQQPASPPPGHARRCCIY